MSFKRLPLDHIFITSPFGPRVLDGVAGFHDAIDLRAPVGTSLFMPDDGTVEHTSSAGKCGQSIAVRLVSGLRVVFCHLSRVFVSPGMSVGAGTVIGETGDSGSAAGKPHLHMMVKRILPDGKLSAAIDPAFLVNGGAGGGAAGLVVLAVLAAVAFS